MADPDLYQKPGAAYDIKKIKRNVRRMMEGGAADAEIDSYLSDENVTAEMLRTSPVAGPNDITTDTPQVQAYDPTFMERLNDLFINRQKGARAPELPEDAGLGMKALDVMETFNRGVDTAARGMTGGTVDEAAGLGRAVGATLPGSANPGGFGENFQEGSNAVNGNIDIFKQNYPVAGNVIEGAGMVTSPIFRTGQAYQDAGPTIFSRAMRGGATGAAVGGGTAAAYNEGGLTDRAAAGAFGAATGGALGFLLPPLIESGTKGGQGFYNTYQNMKAAKNDPQAQARALLQRALDRDQMTPLPGQGEALASAGGPNVQALARQSTVAPGNARTVANDYFSTAADNAPEVIGQAARRNIAGENFMLTIDDLTAQQQAASRPAYDAFYAMDPEAFNTPFFTRLIQSDNGRQLLGKARQIAELERLQGRTPYNVMEQMIDAEGNVSTQQAISPRAADYLKQALDQEVEQFVNPITGRVEGPLGHQWDQLRRAFLRNADEASTVDGVSLYGQARAAYSGPAQLKTAARNGTQAFKGGELTAEKIRRFEEMTPGQQSAFRIGLAEAVLEKAREMGPNTDAVNLFIKGGANGNSGQLIRAYLQTPEAFDDFIRTLQQQSRIVKASRTVLGGSPTARIEADKASALEDQLANARDIWNMATGGVGQKISGFTSAVQRLRDKASNLQRGVSEPVADELAAMLFSPNADRNAALVRSLGAGGPGIFPRNTDPALGLLQLQRQKTLGLFGPATAAPAGAGIGGNY
jgi:hypothetical protein